MRIAVVEAARDENAGVWIVQSSDVEGLWVEGETFEEFRRNVTAAVSDLLSDDADDIAIEVIAPASLRARTAA